MLRKVALIAGIVVLVAVAGWSALWFTGRNSVETRLEQEIARLEAEGYEIAHGDRSIGGFPFAYDVAYEDVVVTGPHGGLSYELPRIAGLASLGDPGTVRFLFPPKFRAILRPGADLEESGLPEVLAFDIEADDLVVETSPPAGPLMEFEVEARSLLMVSVEAEAAALGVAVELGGVDATLSAPFQGSMAPYRGRASIDRLDYVVSVVDPQGVRTTVEGLGDAITLSGTSTLTTRADWEALFSPGPAEGTAEFVYQAGPMSGQVKVQGAGPEMDGTVEQSAGAGGGVLRIGEGRIDLRASSQNNLYRLAPDAPTQPIRGEVRLGSLDLVYDAPLSPTEEMQPFTMRLALSGLEAAEALWALLDPDGTLDREPAHLVAEVTGTGRLMAPLEAGSVELHPLELGQVEIVALTLDALGAEIGAEGAVEFLQPVNLPIGEVTVRGRNLLDVTGQLAELGLLDQGSYQMAALMSSIYARPGDSEGELVSEIVFTADGITVNGLPVR